MVIAVSVLAIGLLFLGYTLYIRMTSQEQRFFSLLDYLTNQREHVEYRGG